MPHCVIYSAVSNDCVHDLDIELDLRDNFFVWAQPMRDYVTLQNDHWDLILLAHDLDKFSLWPFWIVL